MKIAQKLKFNAIGIGLLMGLIFISIPGDADAGNTQNPDHDIYAQILITYVKNGVVDYAGFKKDENKLDQYLEILEATDVSKQSRKDQMAYYINVYNAWTIKLILTEYPGVKSIKDLGGFFWGPWKKKIVRLNGKVTTLDHIEHDILRPTFKDPRVHFAVNCASKSCPPLISEPYEGSRLDEQLDKSTREFINDRKNNYLAEDNLFVSSIFKWFSEDFNDDVIGFFIKYADDPLKKQLLTRQNQIKVKYLDYDWSLNDR